LSKDTIFYKDAKLGGAIEKNWIINEILRVVWS